MKKIFYFLALSLLTQLSFAQSNSNTSDNSINPEWKQKGDWEFGALVGFTTTTINDSEAFGGDESLMGNGYLFGVTADYFLGKNWSLRPRLNYEKRGIDFSTLGSSFTIEQDFITIGAVVNWHFGKNRRWNLHLGPNYSYSIDDEFLLQSSWGTDFGIGVIIPIEDVPFFIEIDGVTDSNGVNILFTSPNGNPIGEVDSFINRTSLSFGVHF